MADDQTEAAITLAVRLGALGRCETCGATWDKGEVDHDDDQSLDELVDQAREVKDAELAVFDDDACLKEALGRVISDAPSERGCSH